MARAILGGRTTYTKDTEVERLIRVLGVGKKSHLIKTVSSWE